MRATDNQNNRRLLATMTNDPFQPVRLYYAIPDERFVIERLRKLDCMAEVRSKRCWQWLYHAEAEALRFPGGGYEDVPRERRPIVLGRIRFPQRQANGRQSGRPGDGQVPRRAPADFLRNRREQVSARMEHKQLVSRSADHSSAAPLDP